MSQPHPTDHSTPAPTPFVGIGTILYTDIIRINTFPDVSGPLEMLDMMRRHQDFACRVIQSHHGEISQFIGSATVAYWLDGGEGENHAAAFAAAQHLLTGLPGLLAQQNGAQYDVRVTLGTGELAGQFFGPIRQYQIVGMARAVADRLDRARASAGSCVRLSQYTADLLGDVDVLIEAGAIAREGLEALRVFEWRHPR